MTIRKWLFSKYKIFFVLIFLTFSFSFLRGQQLSPVKIQTDILAVKPDSGLSAQKRDSLRSISNEEIQKEMHFGTREKIGSCIGGGLLGFPIGTFIFLKAYVIAKKPENVEGPEIVPVGIAAGSLGAILGAKIMYEIVKHSEKKAARNRLLRKKKNKEQIKYKKPDY